MFKWKRRLKGVLSFHSEKRKLIELYVQVHIYHSLQAITKRSIQPEWKENQVHFQFTVPQNYPTTSGYKARSKIRLGSSQNRKVYIALPIKTHVLKMYMCLSSVYM